ncbi:hypothetical protein T484DRAFT_3643582, partial [Baffinella frigidus]
RQLEHGAASRSSACETINPGGAPKPEPGTRNPEPGTRNPEPGTRNPEPGTRNPKPGTPNPEPETRNPGFKRQTGGAGLLASFLSTRPSDEAVCGFGFRLFQVSGFGLQTGGNGVWFRVSGAPSFGFRTADRR